MIFRLHPDYQHYLSFVLDSKVVRSALGDETMFHFSRHPKRYADTWVPFEVEFASLGRKNGAMPDIIERNGRLFMNERAYEVLYGLCEPHGEFLPITFDSNRGYLFNITALADNALDPSLCHKNEFDEVDSIGFREDALNGMSIFRIAYDTFSGVFVSQHFKDAVSTSGLTGLVFSSDIGTAFPIDESALTPIQH